MSPVKPFLNRARILLGNDAMTRLDSVRVIIFGVGGVGSWCAESLVRSGVTHLTVVDSDVVCVSNINRQMMATTLTVGLPKTEALRRRLLEINPDADISLRTEFFSEENAGSFDFDSFDYVVDCIDSLKEKALLIVKATRSRARLFSSMGAALKIDPSRVKVAEFWKVVGCPLARALRQRFKKSGVKPARKFLCVFSDELLSNREDSPLSDTPDSLNPAKAHTNGSLHHITAMFGLTLAGLVVKDIYSRP